MIRYQELWRLFSQFVLEIRLDLVGRNKVGTINIQKMKLITYGGFILSSSVLAFTTSSTTTTSSSITSLRSATEKCYISDGLLPDTEIKCGLQGRYLDRGHLRNGETGLFDPDDKRRFTDPNILFGTKNRQGEKIPWQVSFRYNDETVPKERFCGGVIIDSRTIVTSAHCFWEGPKNNGFWKVEKFEIAVGSGVEPEYQMTMPVPNKHEILPSDAKFGVAIYSIDIKNGKGQVIIHPDYSGEKYGADDKNRPHDIAIVVLPEDSPIKFPKNSDAKKVNNKEPIGTLVRPICLPLPGSQIKSEPLKPECLGSNITHYNDHADPGESLVFGLNGIELATLRDPNFDLLEAFESGVDTSQLITRRWTLAGCLSRRFECDRDRSFTQFYASDYTRVSEYIDFILEHAKFAQTMEDEILKPCKFK